MLKHLSVFAAAALLIFGAGCGKPERVSGKSGTPSSGGKSEDSADSGKDREGGGESPFGETASTPPSTESPFKINQASVNGLLVAVLGSGKYAGSISKLTATASRRSPKPKSADINGARPPRPAEFKPKFNQEVGGSMASALGEVWKFMRLRHGDVPADYNVEFGFQEQYSAKDGPSAAVACALLFESLFTGDELDPAFAVTGDMNADGSVRPVGGITGKIRGAALGSAEIMALPEANAKTLTDLVLIEGPESVSKIQILIATTFEEALALARKKEDREPAVNESIDLFTTVQEIIDRDPDNALQLLKNAKVQERLTKVIELTPNHASARLMLAAGQNRLPQKLTLQGSFAYLDQAFGPALKVIEEGAFDSDVERLDKEYGDAWYGLVRLRSKLDTRTVGLADGLIDFCEALRELSKLTNGSARSPRFKSFLADLRASAGRVGSEYDKLSTTPEIVEELELMR